MGQDGAGFEALEFRCFAVLGLRLLVFVFLDVGLEGWKDLWLRALVVMVVLVVVAVVVVLAVLAVAVAAGVVNGGFHL